MVLNQVHYSPQLKRDPSERCTQRPANHEASPLAGGNGRFSQFFPVSAPRAVCSNPSGSDLLPSPGSCPHAHVVTGTQMKAPGAPQTSCMTSLPRPPAPGAPVSPGPLLRSGLWAGPAWAPPCVTAWKLHQGRERPWSGGSLICFHSPEITVLFCPASRVLKTVSFQMMSGFGEGEGSR